MINLVKRTPVEFVLLPFLAAIFPTDMTFFIAQVPLHEYSRYITQCHHRLKMPSPRRHTCEAPLHMWNIPPRATSVREIPFLKRQPTRQKSHLRFNISIHSSNLRRNIAYWLFSLLLLRLLGGHLPEYSKCNKGGRKHENKFFPTIDT